MKPYWASVRDPIIRITTPERERHKFMPYKRNRKTLKDLYAAFRGRISETNWRQM